MTSAHCNTIMKFKRDEWPVWLLGQTFSLVTESFERLGILVNFMLNVCPTVRFGVRKANRF